jgi:ribonucleotide reductase alpha subunit
MKVVKRNGDSEQLNFSKINYRLAKLIERKPVLSGVVLDELCIQIITNLYDGITTKEIDEISARLSASKIDHPDYNTLASRISVSNLQKNTPKKFSQAVEILGPSIIHAKVLGAIKAFTKLIDDSVVDDNDYLYDFFGLKTLEKSYLLKKDGVVVETPQFMLMRTALGLHCTGENVEVVKETVEKALESYSIFSKLLYTHASPTLFNSGCIRQQNSSCFLLNTSDSLDKIMKTLGDCAQISKYAGGIGVNIGDIRGKNSVIRGTGGKTDGIIKLLRIFNDLGRYANQSGKRNGSIAAYLPTHHTDILEFLDIRKNTGDENLRARDLFSALWVSDYFMECVENDADWDLLSPDDCPDLSDSFGDHYKSLHIKYVKAGLSRQTLKAREIWSKIIVSQIETGMPYILYADAANRRNNQSNLGTIKNSNLCVSGDTKILTSKGHLKISSLENECVEVWNGEKFTETVVRKTGTSQHLMKVMTSDGSELFCTPYHKFYNTDGDCIRAADLVEGTYLETCSFPVIKSIRNLEMIQQLFDRELCRKEDKFEVSNPYKEYLSEIKLVLQTLGCNVLLKQDRNSWKLVLTHRDVYDLYFLGINFKGFIPIGKKRELLGVRVVSTEFTEMLDETTYCFTESERGKGVFNGILTGNCAEVMLRANEEEIATCNIATVSLPKHVSVYENGVKYFDFDKLLDTVGTIVENLNRVIDVNFYPVPETKSSNGSHRPIIIGAQGLQNLFFELGIPFESYEGRLLNKKIYEAIHYASIKRSCELSKIHGPYSSFEGSPLSEGIFQYNSSGYTGELSFDWDSLRSEVVKHGLRNSMLTGSPPTASTSQILGNYESFEPVTNNFMTRDTLSGNFPVINRYLINDLIKINCWNTDIKEKIMRENGSIQGIPEIPENLKNLYKTVWEVSQKTLIDYSADRQLFTDHSQSLNIFMTNPSIAKISSMHFYGWKAGLKTGMYYLRTRAMVTPEKFTVSSGNSVNPQEISCPLKKPNSPEECAACSG